MLAGKGVPVSAEDQTHCCGTASHTLHPRINLSYVIRHDKCFMPNHKPCVPGPA